MINIDISSIHLFHMGKDSFKQCMKINRVKLLYEVGFCVVIIAYNISLILLFQAALIPILYLNTARWS